MRPLSTVAGLARAHERLESLYEISTRFASFTNVEETFAPILVIASKTLPLRSAVLVEMRDSVAHMFVWGSSSGPSAQHMQGVKAHVRAAHRYLIRDSGIDTIEPIEHIEVLPLMSGPAGDDAVVARQLIVLPLAVANRAPFGVLQLEGIGPLDKADLMFVNSIVNQLSVALNRDRAGRQNITRREHAEEGKAEADTRSVESNRHRIDAEASSDRYQALAAENARLYNESKQAVRVREQILAIVSHDLRNPLSTIVMTTGILAKQGTLPDSVARIRRAADRMLRLIEDLLDFASIEAGNLAIRRKPENAGVIILETATSFEDILAANGLELRTAVAPALPAISCDRDRILQILSNLVGNATKATPAGGHIGIAVSVRGSDVVFAVSDDGPGISEEDVKHLFERYWRSGQAEYRGTGLGLAISRGIVAAHGGQLWVETTLGQGATFFFTIPVVDEETAPPTVS
jgi:signal transduction histidine kinase